MLQSVPEAIWMQMKINFDQVLAEHVVNQYDSLAKWKTAWPMWLTGDQECYFCQIFSIFINHFEAFISFLSKDLSSRGETTPVSNAYSCYSIWFYKNNYMEVCPAIQTSQHFLSFELRSIFFFIIQCKNRRCHPYWKTRQEGCTRACVVGGTVISNPSASAWM